MPSPPLTVISNICSATPAPPFQLSLFCIGVVAGTMRGLDDNLLSFTLWTYCATNSNQRGDLWNDEVRFGVTSRQLAPWVLSCSISFLMTNAQC